MKTPLAFLAGAGVGALAMWLAMPKATTSPSGPERRGQETAHQEGRKGGSPTRDDGGALPSKTKRPVATADDEEAKILDEDDEDSPEMRGIRESMAKELAARKARRLDERVAALKDRLNLDDATAAKVRAALASGEEEEDRVMEAVEGKDPAPVEPGEPTRKREALDESITKLLSPNQATAYKEFAAEQKENRIEVATGREMTRLQANLTLTPDQKDKVYQALNEIAAKEEEDGRQAMDLAPKEMKARQQARLDALRPLLTPGQFEEYERRSTASLRILGGEPGEDGE